MSNPAYIPPQAPPSQPVPAGTLNYDQLPTTGVHRILDPFQDRDRHIVRWGGVLAGVFIALGVQVLLTLLGIAVGLTGLGIPARSEVVELTVGTGLWFALQSIIAFSIGGFVGSRIGGSVRAFDGAFSGLLTWSVAVTISALLFGVSAAMASNAAAFNIQRPPEARPAAAEVTRQEARDAATGAAWYGFGAAAITLLAAAGAGALGTLGGRHRRAYAYGQGEPYQNDFREDYRRPGDVNKERERESARIR